MPPLKTTYRPAIDSLRACAAIAVALSHWVPWGAWRINWGYAGVGLFFVISGYVISRSYAQSFASGLGWGNLVPFYGRRIFRIWPAFYCALALHIAFGDITPGTLWSHIVFVFNLFMVWDRNFLHPIHFWSICVEQQFYLVFPLLALFVVRRNVVLGLLAVILAMAPLRYVAYAASGGNEALLFLSPISCLDPLLAGILAAQAERAGTRYETLINVAGSFGLAILFLMMVLGRTSEGFLSNTAMALIGAWLLYNSNFERSPLAFLDRAPLRHLGRVSYGFYLYHLLIGRQIARYLEPVSPEVFAMVAGSLTLLAATVSWYWFERPLNRLGHQLFSIRHVQESRSLESNILCWKSEAHPHELDVWSRQLVVRIGGEQ